jgi:hypothetical protein
MLSYSISGTGRVNSCYKPVDNINARNDRIMITNGTYSWLFVSRFPILKQRLAYFSLSWLITGCSSRLTTQRVSQVDPVLCTLPKHMSSTPVFCLVNVAQSLFYVYCKSLFVLFYLTIILSVLRLTVTEYPFGIFKLFLVITHWN